MTTATSSVSEPVRAEVLNHVRRYRMTVLEAVHRLPAFRCGTTRFVKSVLFDFCRTGHLDCLPLYRGRHYYFISGSLASNTSGSPDQEPTTGPLSESAKIRAYSMFAFCCLADRPRERLTQQDFKQHFPALCRPGMPMNYYIDTSVQPPRLGYLRIDSGGRGRWDRVVAKYRDDLASHLQHQAFRDLIDQRLFEITLITALPQKAERIRGALQNVRDVQADLVRLCVLPELINLIAPAPT